MAFHTKKAFAEMCGMKTGNLSVYEKRGKVLYSGELIDDTIEPNVSFLQKWGTKAKAEEARPEPAKAPPPVPVLTTVMQKPPSPVAKTKARKVQDPAQTSLYALEQEKISLQNEKLTEEIDLLRKKKEKIEGESIPVDLVKAIISQLSQSFVSSYRDLTDNFLIEMSKKKDIPNDEMAELRGILLEGMNKTSHRAVSEAKREMRNIIKIFSSKKDVGEHG